MSITITKEKALCMFCGERYNEENAKMLMKKLEKSEGLVICYIDKPIEPIISHSSMIAAQSWKYRLDPAQLEEKPCY